LGDGNSTRDALCDSLEHLIMMPAVSAYPQSFRATTQYMLKGPLILLAEGACWCLNLSPGEEVGWTWQHVIDCLNQEFYPVGFSLPKLSPCDFALHCSLPSCPGALLPHPSHLASSLFLNSCTHLLQDQGPLLFTFCLIIARSSAAQASFPMCH